eukprot:scaffold20892_cov112-Isochrysis_galbana.AAC.2
MRHSMRMRVGANAAAAEARHGGRNGARWAKGHIAASVVIRIECPAPNASTTAWAPSVVKRDRAASLAAQAPGMLIRPTPSAQESIRTTGNSCAEKQPAKTRAAKPRAARVMDGLRGASQTSWRAALGSATGIETDVGGGGGRG